MPVLREVVFTGRSHLVSEGAGVLLHRAVGFGDEYEFDPFLLLDDIHSADPADYTPGFPWHPHRGIETVTYVLNGSVEHGDSMGNEGVIASGDIQWMTAGSGVVHQEMPKITPGVFRGLQLWVNLPASGKMTPPRYRSIEAASVPSAPLEGGGEVKIIAGNYAGLEGPAREIVRRPVYLDVILPPGGSFFHDAPPGHTVFAYVLYGSGTMGGSWPVSHANVVLFGKEGRVEVSASDGGMRFLLFSGEPLKEPIAWRGPIVMNTEAELLTAFDELERGSFLKKHG